MALNYDIALSNNDLLIRDGDFVVAESDQQHIIDTINAFPGWWKQFHPDGVGLFRYMRSSGMEQQLCRDVKIQLEADGYQVNNPSAAISPAGTLILNPNASRP